MSFRTPKFYPQSSKQMLSIKDLLLKLRLGQLLTPADKRLQKMLLNSILGPTKRRPPREVQPIHNV